MSIICAIAGYRPYFSAEFSETLSVFEPESSGSYGYVMIVRSSLTFLDGGVRRT